MIACWLLIAILLLGLGLFLAPVVFVLSDTRERSRPGDWSDGHSVGHCRQARTICASDGILAVF